MKLDILAIAAHPDDAEMSCGGTIAQQISLGRKVGIIDLTQGELGTRGTPAIRAAEATEAARILGVSVRENLGMRDGFFRNDEANQLKIVEVMRRYQPEIILTNAETDRHPNHGEAAELTETAWFLSGLRMIETFEKDGTPQTPWRPKRVYHYIQDSWIKPDFVVDISDFWHIKDASIRAYKSQFHDPNSTEPTSYLSSPAFMEFLKARSQEMGHQIGVAFGEGFTTRRFVGVKDLLSLI